MHRVQIQQKRQMNDIYRQEIYQCKEKSKKVGIRDIHFPENVAMKIINLLVTNLYKEFTFFTFE